MAKTSEHMADNSTLENPLEAAMFDLVEVNYSFLFR